MMEPLGRKEGVLLTLSAKFAHDERGHHALHHIVELALHVRKELLHASQFVLLEGLSWT